MTFEQFDSMFNTNWEDILSYNYLQRNSSVSTDPMDYLISNQTASAIAKSADLENAFEAFDKQYDPFRSEEVCRNETTEESTSP